MDSAALQLGITAPEECADRRLVERLVTAFNRSRESRSYDENSQWFEFRRLHEPIVSAIHACDVDAVGKALLHPERGYLFYGFEDLGVWTDEPYEDPYHCALYALHCAQTLERLARALGVLSLPNPEAPDRTVATPEPDQLLARVQDLLKISIAPPEVYPGYRGLQTSYGVIGERVLNALYCAFRIRQLTAGIARPRILEVGGGLGRLAHYAYLMGLRDYTIVDLPITNLAHGHFLGRALGADRIVLDGEPGSHNSPDKIKIMTAERFFAGDGYHPQFDLVVNIDSFTEIGAGLAERYFRRFAALAPCLLSVNHEVNEYRVHDLFDAGRAFAGCERMAYWLRDGYVEEIYRSASPIMAGASRARAKFKIGGRRRHESEIRAI